MSRKTVVFKMPGADPKRRDEAHGDEALPPNASSKEAASGQIILATEPDRWVQAHEMPLVPERAAQAPAPVTFASQPRISLSFDLAAERSLPQMVALSMSLPPMLGWFWVTNAMNRYQRMFGVGG